MRHDSRHTHLAPMFLLLLQPLVAPPRLLSAPLSFLLLSRAPTFTLRLPSLLPPLALSHLRHSSPPSPSSPPPSTLRPGYPFSGLLRFTSAVPSPFLRRFLPPPHRSGEPSPCPFLSLISVGWENEKARVFTCSSAMNARELPARSLDRSNPAVTSRRAASSRVEPRRRGAAEEERRKGTREFPAA